ncbi:MAG TPA: cation:proton antiporter [Pyrinomonadaceae bacterium]|nr:cation:proton antiporter [Pyrinomonadaceae bacterium]
MAPQSNSSFLNARTYLPYLLLLLIFGGGVWLILTAGSGLQPAETIAIPPPDPMPSRSVFWQNFRAPVSILLTQIVVILVVAGWFRRLFRRLGQPPVMGEMIAGIVLGPSVLGLIYPIALPFLFPPASMETLRLLSQIGVVLFMFTVGMEVNVQHLREKGSAAVMISHASIIVPFLLGSALSLFLYRGLAPSGTSFNAFALFIGVAMSITAFPVLARILEDRNLTQTTLGSIALTCAAVDDATAWCILAIVIALVKSTGVGSSALTIVLTIAFAAGMMLLVRPELARIIKNRDTQQHRRRLIPIVLAVVLGCALLTETIGIHALFGAFMAGLVMPPSTEFRIFLKDKLEAFGSYALLPLFFAFTGLRTQIALINDWQSWALCGVIILVAIAGKLGGSMLMSRWTGMSWSQSFSIGVLMNTRGLVELVVLNIGYDLGILSERIFAMMVIMALVTTFMTGPLLSLVRNKGDRRWEERYC